MSANEFAVFDFNAMTLLVAERTDPSSELPLPIVGVTPEAEPVDTGRMPVGTRPRAWGITMTLLAVPQEKKTLAVIALPILVSYWRGWKDTAPAEMSLRVKRGPGVLTLPDHR